MSRKPENLTKQEIVEFLKEFNNLSKDLSKGLLVIADKYGLDHTEVLLHFASAFYYVVSRCSVENEKHTSEESL